VGLQVDGRLAPAGQHVGRGAGHWPTSAAPLRPGARRIHYPVRTLNNSLQYFVRVTAVNRAGLSVSAAGLPIKVDTAA
jgi:hypothetical protein